MPADAAEWVAELSLAPFLTRGDGGAAVAAFAVCVDAGRVRGLVLAREDACCVLAVRAPALRLGRVVEIRNRVGHEW